MPRTKSGSLPSYRHHKRTGQAVVTLNGHDHYLGPYGSPASKEAYNRLLGEWLQRGQIASSSPSPESRIQLTINGVILGYVKHAETYYRTSPKERDKIKLSLRPLKKLYGRSQAAAFGPLALKVVREDMMKTQQRVVRRKVGKDNEVVIQESTIEYWLSRRTINMRIDVLKRMFKWAVSNELVPATVYEGLRTVEGLKAGRSEAKETIPVKPVCPDDVEKILPIVTRHVRGMILLQQLTGARSGEICSLRKCDIDTSGPVWVYHPLRHKNRHRGQHRPIYLGPQAQALLREFFPADPTDYVFSPRQAVEERFAALRLARRSKVPPSQMDRRKPKPKRKPGKRYTVQSYRHAVAKGCRKAEIATWHPHQLRHAAATRLRKEYGVELARILLGHKTAFTTEIYAEADQAQAMEVVARIG
jgi:integrase